MTFYRQPDSKERALLRDQERAHEAHKVWQKLEDSIDPLCDELDRWLDHGDLFPDLSTPELLGLPCFIHDGYFAGDPDRRDRVLELLTALRDASEEIRSNAGHLIHLLHADRQQQGSIARVQAEAKYVAQRQERLNRRPSAPSVLQMGRKCVKCNKKPARIDDYCKKCAREVGIIVHGKIGEA